MSSKAQPVLADLDEGGVVFIAGLSHSGSTLLSLLLARLPRTVALGEVFNYVRRRPEVRKEREWRGCSCGSPVEGCEFWGPIQNIVEDPATATKDKYQRVFDHARYLYGSDVVIIDSSKKTVALPMLPETQEVAVVHLVRDVRSWAVSKRDRDIRRNEYSLAQLVRRYGVRGISGRLRASTWYSFRLWRSGNRQVHDDLSSHSYCVVRIGYEQLVGAPGDVLKAVVPQLGLEFHDDILNADNPALSHVMVGNNMRYSEEKTRDIMFSTRWLAREDWLLPSLFLRSTMAMNKEWVYARTSPVDRYDELLQINKGG